MREANGPSQEISSQESNINPHWMPAKICDFTGVATGRYMHVKRYYLFWVKLNMCVMNLY